MSKTARLQDLQWRLETAGYDLVAALMRVFPIDGASAFGGAVFKLFGPLTSANRTALRQLNVVFAD
jgi:lauroyl/myristoyl acyltransferase